MPTQHTIDVIEYSLEQPDELSIGELDMLKKTGDTLVLYMENVNAPHSTRV